MATFARRHLSAGIWIASLIVGLDPQVFAAGAGAAPAGDHQAEVAKAAQLEATNALPIDQFYDDNAIADAKRAPGSLIRAQPATGYALPRGATATRILYTSRGSAGDSRIASAVVVIPPGRRPSAGWPLVVWAHGTTGVARMCGPSVMKSLGYNVPPLVAAGFAVLVVDYAGLATAGPHEYLSRTAQANDVIFAVPATQAAVAGITSEWTVVGHSQGGYAAWAVAEQETERNDPRYLGAVSLAGAQDYDQLFDHIAVTTHQMFYVEYLAFGIKARYPQFDIGAMVQPGARAEFETLTTRSCWDYANATFAQVRPGTVLRADWKDDPTVRKFLASNIGGERPVAGALFVASGLTDSAVPHAGVEAKARGLCRFHATVSYRAYTGEHDEMLDASLADTVRWIRDRFAHRPAPSICR